MPMLRTVKCDVCGKEYSEQSYGLGFPGWMLVNGINLDGNEQVWPCPAHMKTIADKIDDMKNGKRAE